MQVYFPGTLVPLRRGTIEVWIKLWNVPQSLGVTARPGLWSLIDPTWYGTGLPLGDADHRALLQFNANDGLAGGGLCAAVGIQDNSTGYPCECATGKNGKSDKKINSFRVMAPVLDV